MYEEVIYGVSKQRHTVLYLGKLDDEVLGTGIMLLSYWQFVW